VSEGARGVARGTAGGGHLTCWSGLLRFQLVHAATVAADAEQPQLGRGGYGTLLLLKFHVSLSTARRALRVA